MQRVLAAVLALSGLAGCLTGPADEPLQRGDGAAPRAEGEYPPWADPATALIRPGALIHTEKRDCASNFVFTKADNTSVFLGTTAYCVRDLPIGALATVGGPEEIAVLVYSSWQTMAERGEADPHAQEYNDFAVFRIDSASREHVSPVLPEVGGPAGMGDAAGAGVGARVRERSEGPEAPVAGASPPAWREGVVTGRVGEWALLVHSPSPALPGGTGGPVLDMEGNALGIVVNVGLMPNPGANGVARLDALMAYAATNAKLDMRLATP